MPKYIVTHTLTFEIDAKTPEEAEDVSFSITTYDADTYDVEVEEQEPAEDDDF